MAPIRRQVVEVRVYRAVADRSRGRRVGGALIPLIDLMDCSAPLGEDVQDPFLPSAAFQQQSVGLHLARADVQEFT